MCKRVARVVRRDAAAVDERPARRSLALDDGVEDARDAPPTPPTRAMRREVLKVQLFAVCGAKLSARTPRREDFWLAGHSGGLRYVLRDADPRNSMLRIRRKLAD